MKLRIGFVSNSSSASFLIATKTEITFPLLRKKLYQHLKSRSHYSRNLIEEIATLMFKEMPSDFYENVEDVPFYEEVKDKGFNHYYPGGIPNRPYAFLFGLKIIDDDFVLLIDRGY